MRVRVAVLWAVLGGGCGGVSRYTTRDVDPAFQFEEKPRHGLVVISVRKTAELYPVRNLASSKAERLSWLLLEYGDGGYTDDAKRGVIPAEDRRDAPDFDSPLGYLAIRMLEPGEHYIRMPCMRGSSHPQKGSGIPFTVEAGKVFYLGAVHISGPACQWRVSDAWETDQTVFARRLPGLPVEAVEKRLLGDSYSGGPGAASTAGWGAR